LWDNHPIYYITNTAKSLLAGIEDINDDIIWMNGDVVFEKEALETIIGSNHNSICVNNTRCAEEEVKYIVNEHGFISEISKKIPPEKALGEAVGINKVVKSDITDLIQALRECKDNDYFEKGIEILIKRNKIFKPIDISQYKCIEIDFEEEWDYAFNLFTE